MSSNYNSRLLDICISKGELMKHEHGIFAPLVGIIYIILGMLIIIGLMVIIGDGIRYGDNDVINCIDYVLGIIYTIYKGE